MALCLYFAAHAIDYLTSDATQENLNTMWALGFSGSYVAGCYIFNALTWWVGIKLAVEQLAATSAARCDLPLLLHVAATLATTEVFFFFSHRALHYYAPRLHLLHHCCKRPSYTTNLFFHPLDLAVEFAGPVAAVVLLNTLVFRDPWAMVCSFGVVVGWYGADHDEYLQLPHYLHHRSATGCYTIYVRTRLELANDGVKRLLFQKKSS
eukprot:g15900.t1